jgi:hypothetical protein
MGYARGPVYSAETADESGRTFEMLDRTQVRGNGAAEPSCKENGIGLTT